MKVETDSLRTGDLGLGGGERYHSTESSEIATNTC